MSAPVAAAGTAKPVIGVIFYSTFGHVATLAEEIIKGVEEAGAIVKPYQIEETLPKEVLEKMSAGASLQPRYPLITPEALKELDGFLLGFPTRYGRTPAQVSAFFDRTGGLWASGALVGKYAGTFTSTASQHGGQETTHLTTIPFFAHHGIIYVPIGYADPYVASLNEIHGASAYGASTIAAGDGSRTPTAGELATAKFQGQQFTKVVAQAVRGRHLLAAESGAGTGAAAVGHSTTAAVDPATSGAGTGAAAAGAGAVGAAGATAATTGAARTDVASQRAADNAELGTGMGESGAKEPIKEAGTPPAAPTATSGAKDSTATTPAAAAAGTKAAETKPAAAAAASKPAAAGANPSATAPKQKKGGLFSCCSGNNID